MRRRTPCWRWRSANDSQFGKCAGVLGHPEWAQDALFCTNRARVENRAVLDALISEGAGAGHGGALGREAQGRRRSVRTDQHGGAGARRSAHRRAPDGGDRDASDHRRAEDARHSVQVFRQRPPRSGARRRRSASTPTRSCRSSEWMRPRSRRCGGRRWYDTPYVHGPQSRLDRGARPRRGGAPGCARPMGCGSEKPKRTNSRACVSPMRISAMPGSS